MLTCLKETFGKGFMKHLAMFVFKEAKEEVGRLPNQPSPSNFCVADLEAFSYSQMYQDMGDYTPVLHSAVRGAMSNHYKFEEVSYSPESVSVSVLKS